MNTKIVKADNKINTKNRQKAAELVVNLGLFFNAVLALVKVSAGILGHSQGLLADGINSVSDVIYFVVVKIFVRLSGKPADSEHPYGHHQLESIAALVVGAFVITTGAAIFWDSVNSAFDIFVGTAPQLKVRLFALVVALATIICKIFLMLHANRTGRTTGNLAIKALAKDHRNDIFASMGASIGILLNMLGITWGDPLAGAVVALIVAKTGMDILREASSDLMDNVPSRELAERIHELLDGMEEIKSIEDIHAHRFGPYLVVNLTIGIDGDLRVKDGDKIADTVESTLISGLEMLRKVYVHYHPVQVGKPGDGPLTLKR
ncbi:MAG: cation diffusion facilitator family transporter [Proteobacteria bacterium]|nr:cation transporter [Desulfobacula sp.]MBU3953622.1 cation diffusion facilitator family transporter [Pseudomonadota bacterium]MBU4131194.1 cation diffusion facilitator family transporter [Pseudomonadota bacterium]